MLAQDSEKVNAALQLIQSITDQTGFLALNAALEAARSGERGRQFASVAGQLQMLASRTHESTREIQSIVAHMEPKVVHAMAQATIYADEQSLDLTRDVCSIDAAAQMLTQMQTQLLTAANEQTLEDNNVANSSMAINETARFERLVDLMGDLHMLVANFRSMQQAPEFFTDNLDED